MGDRAPVQVILWTEPTPEEQAGVASIFEAYDFGEDFSYGAPGPVKAFTVYGNDEANLMTYAEIAEELMKRTPRLGFVAWGDPKYEFDGSIVMYTPGLGRYEGRCNANGDPYLTAQEIASGLTAGDLEECAGLPWVRWGEQETERHEEAHVG